VELQQRREFFFQLLVTPLLGADLATLVALRRHQLMYAPTACMLCIRTLRLSRACCCDMWDGFAIRHAISQFVDQCFFLRLIQGIARLQKLRLWPRTSIRALAWCFSHWSWVSASDARNRAVAASCRARRASSTSAFSWSALALEARLPEGQRFIAIVIRPHIGVGGRRQCATTARRSRTRRSASPCVSL
jgi:hypothetical protein